MYLIDTNIMLAILFDEPRANNCSKLFGKIENRELEALITIFSIYSAGIAGIRNKKAKKLREFLTYLSSLENVEILTTTIEENIEITQICEKEKLDFDEGMQYFMAKKFDCKGIVSYDKDFDKTDLKRILPEEIVAELQNGFDAAKNTTKSEGEQ